MMSLMLNILFTMLCYDAPTPTKQCPRYNFLVAAVTKCYETFLRTLSRNSDERAYLILPFWV